MSLHELRKGSNLFHYGDHWPSVLVTKYYLRGASPAIGRSLLAPILTREGAQLALKTLDASRDFSFEGFVRLGASSIASL